MKRSPPLFDDNSHCVRNAWLAQKSVSMRGKILLGLLLLISTGLLHCEPLLLTELPAGSLGSHASLLVEGDIPLSLNEAQKRQHEGLFHQSKQSVLTYGIGSRPVWVHMTLLNPSEQSLLLRLIVGTTWIDQMEVFIIHDGRVSANWQTGDKYLDAYGFTPGVGFMFPLRFLSGLSELYLRVDTIDPLVLPIQLLSQEQAVSNERLMHYSYGFIYGFLIALAAYNAMLFAGFRERSHLYYSLYLASLVLLNMAYTGHGYAWLWPNQPHLQRYVILVLMVAYSCFGLLFASRFLALTEYAPRLLKMVQLYCLFGVLLIGLCIVMGEQLGAALVAFVFMTLFSLCMVLLGIIAIRNDRMTGHYFLAAAIFGMLGAATTPLAVWGWLPFTALTFHALELGVIIEATLFALALAYQMRSNQEKRLRAEHFARIDSLTSLYNRRGFMELAEPIWSTAVRNARPLILIMLDLDDFKKVNDQYGHDTGDQVLVETAHLLAKVCRAGDILSRWGGEEFMLLMPETNLEDACIFAERLRHSIEAQQITTTKGSIFITASFGIAARDQHLCLEELINEVDGYLYKSKNSGRNRVFSAQDY